MATMRDLLERNGYDMGGGGLVEGPQDWTVQNPLPVDQGGQIIDQLPPITPVMDPTKAATTPMASPWTNPVAAFAPGASQNAPRLFQDPTSGAWTLSEHGNFRRNLSPEELAGAQGYVSQFWANNPTGFIQPGATNYDPAQALSNEQYGQPSNWQSLWTNAGLQPGTTNPLQPQATGTTTPGMTGTLAELSNPERVNQLSQSSYGDFRV